MTSLIKNQILKHLTKFFKDLAPEQLQLSAFKGSCELSNLQLEERVLMDLLSFPVWVKINKAACDQLSIKIPWTRIKSVPIQMNLNEVMVEVEVCDEFRDVDGEDELNLANLINSQAPGKYGFVDRVIDGITVTVNSVLITFKSRLMSATLNLSRVILESRCPNWKPGELSLTRIKDTTRGQILLFKIVEWQTMRLEAKCLTDPLQAPLRLITNHAQCRLTIKKKLDDCSVVAARIFVIFEDILWVLTFAQFISAASFVEYIFTLIKKSPVSKKTDIFESHNSSTETPSNTTFSTAANLISPINSPMPQSQKDRPQILTGNMSASSLMEQKFLCYDLVETSMHLYIDKVDAHLYDDIETTSVGSTKRDSGGALQTTLDQIQVDCYPYSKATGTRKHWYRWFDPSPSSRKQWFQGHLDAFDLTSKTKFLNLDLSNIDRNKLDIQSDQLLSLTVIVKVKDYCMHCVTTKHSNRTGSLGKFIQTDKSYQMPSEMPSVYFELNYFYYFDAVNRMMIYENVPNPLAFVHLSPTKLLFDSPTLLFLNSFHVNLTKALKHLDDLFPDETSAPKIHCRIEILMPQVSLPAKSSPDQQKAQSPTSFLLVKSGKITMGNSIYDKNLLTKLITSIEKLKESPCKPINLGGSYQSSMQNSPRGESNSCSGDWAKVWNASVIDRMSEFSLRNQFWSMEFSPVWSDFMNYDIDDLSNSQRLEPIVEPFNAYAFVHLDLSSPSHKGNRRGSEQKSDSDSGSSKGSSNKRDVISILVSVLDESILANMDKIQFGFFQRLGMQVEKLLQQIKEDASSIIQLDTLNLENTLELNLTAYIKDIKARLILDKKVVKQTHTSQGCDDSYELKEEKRDEIPTNPNVSHDFDPFGGSSSLERSTILMPSIVEQQPTRPQDDRIQEPIEVRDNLGSNENLDECAEVADDASCLLLGPESTLSDTTSHTNLSESNTQSSATSLPLATQESEKLFSKSHNLLLELDEIEKSASLFTKVDLRNKPQLQSSGDQQHQQQQQQQQPEQQQEVEVETISYLELSMSQLMVRRITEAKRKTKF